MSANNHLLYRGYVVDKGTGQGLLGNNMFSLDEYNAYRLDDVRPDVISTIIATGTMLLLALCFGLSR